MKIIQPLSFSMVLAMGLLIIGCHSSKKAFQESKAHKILVEWPQEFDPDQAVFFVHNHIDINASPEAVWNVLIDAEKWSEYYEGASAVTFENPKSEKLEMGAVFAWKTMGFDFKSTITEFEPYKRLAWDSYRHNMKGRHAWLIIPKEFGCTLTTDESQNGSLAKVERIFQPNKLERLHDEWLLGIKERAEKK